MAQAKLAVKTPLAPLQWVTISGQGKLRFEKPDDKDPVNYQYCASAVLNKEQADALNVIIKQFWKDNKPTGATVMKYDVIKAEVEPVVDKEGKPTFDEDGAKITTPTGNYTIQAKTGTQWGDGKPNVIKVLNAAGQQIQLGDKVIGDGSTGVLHMNLGINAYKGNEGVNCYLVAVQLKKFVEYTGSDIQAESLGETEGLEELELDAICI